MSSKHSRPTGRQRNAPEQAHLQVKPRQKNIMSNKVKDIAQYSRQSWIHADIGREVQLSSGWVLRHGREGQQDAEESRQGLKIYCWDDMIKMGGFHIRRAMK